MARLSRLILLGLCLALPARAQEPTPETLQAAQELTALISHETVEQLSSAIFNQMWTSLATQLGGKADEATLTELRGELEKMVIKFTSDAMKDAPAIYARHFTAAEMKDIVAFYRTPTGVKALHELPKVAAESAALMGPRMAPFQREISSTVETVLKKHGYGK